MLNSPKVYKIQVSRNRCYYFVSKEAAENYQRKMAEAQIETLTRKEYLKEVAIQRIYPEEEVE